MRRTIQVVAAVIVAVVAALFVHSLAAPPPTVWVPFLTAPVAAGQPVTAADVQWRQVIQPPPRALQAPTNPIGQIAHHNLLAGQALAAGDLGGLSPNGLKPGEVMWMAPVGSPAASGLPQIGQRVDVWAGVGSNSDSVSVPILLAQGVRVIGLYTAAGLPVGAASSSGSLVSTTPAGVGIIGLAVPRTDLAPLLAAQGLTFVVDPSTHAFALVAAPTAPAPHA